MENTFEQAVRVMFQEETLDLRENSEEAQKHLLESSTLRRHILNASREALEASHSSNPQAALASLLNAFFEFGYRTRRLQEPK